MKKTWISCIKEILTWHSWVDLTRPSLSQQLQPITFFQGHLLGRVKFPWNQNKEAWPRSIGESSLTWDSSRLATLPHSSICILLLKIYLFIIHMQRKFRNFYDVNVEMWNIPHRLTCLSPLVHTWWWCLGRWPLGLWPTSRKFPRMQFEGGCPPSGSDPNSLFIKLWGEFTSHSCCWTSTMTSPHQRVETAYQSKVLLP